MLNEAFSSNGGENVPCSNNECNRVDRATGAGGAVPQVTKWIIGMGVTLMVLFTAGVLSTDEQDRGKPGGCLFQVARGAVVMLVLGILIGVAYYIVSILLAIFWWLSGR